MRAGAFAIMLWPAVCAAQPAAPPRMVFAHYMVAVPTYGGGSTVADYQREIRAAQAAGIDGFALNCGGWSLREPHYKQRALLIYQAALELATDFKLFLSADYCCGLTDEETRDMVETFRDHPNQLRVDGRPVLSTFAGGRHQTDFVNREFADERRIFYVPFYYPTPAAENPNPAQVGQVFADHPTLDGFFHFGAAGDPERIITANRLLAAKWLGAGKVFMCPVTPYYRGLGGNYRCFECRGFEGMADQWRCAIEVGATWVEIVTWNDWGEASYVVPFGDPPQTELWGGHWGPMLSHAGFLEASRHYIAWYKTGVEPAIDRDRLCYFHRLHPKTVPGRPRPDSPELARPAGADGLDDQVYVTAFLTSPATVVIHSGEKSQRYDCPAGVHHLSLPFAPGPQRFVLQRDGRTVIDHLGEHEISTDDAWGNFNYFSGAVVAE